MEGLRKVLQVHMEGILKVLQNTMRVFCYKTPGGSSEGVTIHLEGLLKVLQNTWGVFGVFCRKHGRSSDDTTKTRGGSSSCVANTDGIPKVF